MSRELTRAALTVGSFPDFYFIVLLKSTATVSSNGTCQHAVNANKNWSSGNSAESSSMDPTLMMMVTTCGAQLHLFTSEMFWFPRLPNPGPISDNVPGVVGTTGRCCPLPRPADILAPQQAAATIVPLCRRRRIHRGYSRG